MSKQLRVADVTTMSLLTHQCPCGYLNIHGFWGQLDKSVDRERRMATVTMPCRSCSLILYRKFRLTTGKQTRHRLVDWVILAEWLMNRLPARWWKRIMLTCLRLEKWCPL